MAACRVSIIVVTVLALAGCGREQDLADDAIVALDAPALRAELAAGRVSALRVTQAYLRRIAALDDSGPALGAVIETNPDAEAIARALDDARERGSVGPLHGIPVLLKASIDTADRMATTAGSMALAEHRARRDADIVVRLREAGAVVLGKTNLSEWANFRSSSSTSGWSSLGGQTHNPYVLDRNPCGSSSGSAVAVAARLAPLAVGTETDGSIVCPAAANGIVGVKPTIGAVSQRGIVPLAHSQDTAGAMARSVEGAALLSAVLAGVDPAGALAGAARDVAGLRVGVVRDHPGAGRDAAVEAAVTAALGWLDAAGVELVDPVPAALSPEALEAELTILLAEFAEDVETYLADVEEGPRTLSALIEFNARHAADVMPYFGQELFLTARDSGGTASDGYASALENVREARTALAALLDERGLDALIAPSNSRAWRTDYAAGDAFGVSSSSIAAVTGYPAVTVPAALAGELPLGVSLIGKPGQESTVLALATAIERARGPFPEPHFLPSVAD